MIRTRSSQEEHSTFEPPKKQRKSHHRDKMPQITKCTLLKAMSDVEDEVKALAQDRLSERLKDLREQAKVVLETREEEIKRLHAEIDDLKKEVKFHHHDKMPQISKDTLLKAMSDVEDQIKELDHDKLRERLKYFIEQVKVVLVTTEEAIKHLQAEIDDLKKDVKLLRDKYDELSNENEELKNTLDTAQVTWAWEAHLARFVVDSSTEIKKCARFKQMNRHLNNAKPKDNLLIKIENTIGRWTQLHWDMVDEVRADRKSIAHNDFIDLDLIETELPKIFEDDFLEPAVDMLNILKTTAGLMKFGRLTKFYMSNKKRYPVFGLNRAEEDVVEVIISWDRKFEQIDGLQHVEHEDAKKYLAKYINNPEMNIHYFRVVDFIRYENGKVLGKLAWELEESDHFTRMTDEERMVVNELKSLVLKNSRDVVNNLQRSEFATIAKLHIPDFLPKHLWKYGVRVVKKYFTNK